MTLIVAHSELVRKAREALSLLRPYANADASYEPDILEAIALLEGYLCDKCRNCGHPVERYDPSVTGWRHSAPCDRRSPVWCEGLNGARAQPSTNRLVGDNRIFSTLPPAEVPSIIDNEGVDRSWGDDWYLDARLNEWVYAWADDRIIAAVRRSPSEGDAS